MSTYIATDKSSAVELTNRVTSFTPIIKLKERALSGTDSLTISNMYYGERADLKIYGNTLSVNSRVPSDYQELEYLNGVRNPWINTGVIPTKNTSVDLTYKALDYTNSQYIIGVRDSAINYAINGSQTRSDWDIRFNGTTIHSNINRTPDKMRSKISMVNGTGSWDLYNLDTNEHFSYSFSNQEVTSSLPLGLFCYMSRDDSSTFTYTHYNLIIYSCKIYENDILIRDYIPVKRKSDDALGMYDIVNNEFYGNAGNGNFIAGSKIPSIDRAIEIKSVGERTKNLFDIPEITGSTKDTTINCCITSSIITSCQEYPTSIRNTSDVETSIWRISYTRLDGTIQYTVDDVLRGIVNAQKINASEDNPIVKIVYRGTYIKEGRYSGIQIEYGETQTEYEPYGYKITVKATGKNLLNKNTSIDEMTITPTGEVKAAFYGLTVTDKIFIDPLTTYTYSGMGNVQSTTVGRVGYQFDADDNPIKALSSSTGGKVTFTTEKNCSYVRLIYITASETPMLELGSLDTEFIECNEIVAPVYLKNQLIRIENQSDIIDYSECRLIRYFNQYEFDGTEDWAKHTSSSTGSVFRLDNTLNPALGVSTSLTTMSHFTLTDISSTSTWDSSLYRFSYGTGKVISADRLYVSTTHQNVDTFKEWLALNKPTIIYPINEISEDILNLPELFKDRFTQIRIVSNIKPSKIEVNYWEIV